jgi:hypothetical protein
MPMGDAESAMLSRAACRDVLDEVKQAMGKKEDV